MEEQKRKELIIWINRSLIIFAILGAFLGWKVYGIISEYHKAGKEYEEIQGIALGETQKNGKENSFEMVDFEELSNVNDDIVGWIRFEEPKVINYPIVQGEDNEKYLTTSFEGQKNGAGCIYMDAENSKDFSDYNTFLHGHNKKNGHMFGSLEKYKDKNYYKNYPFFDIYTRNGEKSRFQIFAVTLVDASADSYRKVYVSEEEYKDYINMVRELALYETEVEVTEKSQIVSLSTCTNVRIEERLLIHAVKMNDKNME